MMMMMMMKKLGLKKYMPYVAMVSVQLIYAGMAMLSKAAVARGTNPYVFVTYRQAFATIALAPFTFLHPTSNKAAPLSYSLLLKIFFVSLFGITVSLNLYYMALTYTTATLAAATTNTIPAMTFVMAVILRVEKVSIKEWHGIAKVMGSSLNLCGALVFAFVRGPIIDFINSNLSQHNQMETTNSSSSGNNNNNNNNKGLIKGAVMMISANLVWSLWLIMQRPLMREYPAAPLRLVALQCLCSSLQSSVWAISVERDISLWKLQWDLNLASMLYCGVVVAGMCYVLQLWAVEKKGPVFTAIFTPLALLITSIASALLWKEVLHLGGVCGAMLLVGGLYCVLWGKSKEEVKESHEITEIKVESSSSSVE